LILDLQRKVSQPGTFFFEVKTLIVICGASVFEFSVMILKNCIPWFLILRAAWLGFHLESVKATSDGTLQESLIGQRGDTQTEILNILSIVKESGKNIFGQRGLTQTELHNILHTVKESKRSLSGLKALSQSEMMNVLSTIKESIVVVPESHLESANETSLDTSQENLFAKRILHQTAIQSTLLTAKESIKLQWKSAKASSSTTIQVNSYARRKLDGQTTTKAASPRATGGMHAANSSQPTCNITAAIEAYNKSGICTDLPLYFENATSGGITAFFMFCSPAAFKQAVVSAAGSSKWLSNSCNSSVVERVGDCMYEAMVANFSSDTFALLNICDMPAG